MTTSKNGAAPRAAPVGRLTVNSGDDILASWGNTTFDQTTECFASNTDRDTQWPSPHDGAACYTVDTATCWVRRAGVWQPLAGPGQPPVTGGSNVASYTDAAGETWVAKNGVNGGAWRKARNVIRARWTRHAALTLPNNSANLLALDTKTFDDYGLYNVQTASQFVCPLPGYYRTVMHFQATATAVGQSAYVSLYRNGTQYQQSASPNCGSVGQLPAVLVDEVICVAGDGLAMWVQTYSAGLALIVDRCFAVFEYLGPNT